MAISSPTMNIWRYRNVPATRSGNFSSSGSSADFKGQILRFDQQKNKVLFKRIMVNGMYGDGIGFVGKEDHVWMDRTGFELFNPGDCLWFEADIYRYMRKSDGKLIDYGLRNPDNIEKIESYEVPTD